MAFASFQGQSPIGHQLANVLGLGLFTTTNHIATGDVLEFYVWRAELWRANIGGVKMDRGGNDVFWEGVNGVD